MSSLSKFHRGNKKAAGPLPYISKTKTSHYLYLMNPDTKQSMSSQATFVNPKGIISEDDMKLMIVMWQKLYPNEPLQNLNVSYWSVFVPPPKNGPGATAIPVVASIRVGARGEEPEFFFSAQNTGFVLLAHPLETDDKPSVIEQFVNPGVPIFLEEAETLVKFWQQNHPGDVSLAIYSVSIKQDPNIDLKYTFECEVRSQGEMIAIRQKNDGPLPSRDAPFQVGVSSGLDGTYGDPNAQ